MTAPPLAPIHQKERIALLDILRGFAIFGILIMNMDSYALYWMLNDEQVKAIPFSNLDEPVSFFQNVFCEGKFYSIFSMLFGIGFAIYLSKAEKVPGVLAIFRRRLFVLLLIGFLHLMIWTGDIVMFYAMLGFALIPFRRFSNKTLVILAGCFVLSPIAWYAIKMSNPEQFDLSRHLFGFGEVQAKRIGISSPQDLYALNKSTDYVKMLKSNLVGICFRYGDLLFQSRAFKVFGMFLLGLAIGRARIFQNLDVHTRLFKRVFIWGLLIGLPANVILHVIEDDQKYYGLTSHGLLQTTLYALGVAPLALAYVAGITLLFMRNAGKRMLSVIAPAGKMALTNYIGQTVIGILCFTGLGFSMQPIGPFLWTFFAIAVFVIQIIYSTIWLKYFEYGPLEWLWKSATYGKWQRFKRKD